MHIGEHSSREGVPGRIPTELTSLPPSQEVEFTVDLIPGAQPVSRTLYWMAPVELKELKEQLEECYSRDISNPAFRPREHRYYLLKRRTVH
jgi:hypothetical protein